MTEDSPVGNDFASQMIEGYGCTARDEFFAAVACFKKALKHAPCEAEGWVALGRVLIKLGLKDEALEAMQRAHALAPARSGVAGDLARLYRWHGKDGEAEEMLRAFIERVPGNVPGMCELCHLLAAQERWREAAEVAQEIFLLGASPGVDFSIKFSMALIWLQRHTEAVALLENLAWHNADHADTWLHLGRAYATIGAIEKARKAFDHYMALKPDDNMRGMVELAEYTGPSGLGSEYVRGLFNMIAEHFDDKLISVLGYKAPTVMREALGPFLEAGRRYDVLDLGCGTGLPGLVFKSCAKSLVGIDLSPAMLNQARQRRLYDKLYTGDIVDVMKENGLETDIAVVVDVLPYIGPLERLFEAVHGALRPGGLFALTTEMLSENAGVDYALNLVKRFAHKQSYLRRLATRHGYEVLVCEDFTLRLESGLPVVGTMFVARK